MSDKFLGLLSNSWKALSSFFQCVSYKVSEHLKFLYAVSNLKYKRCLLDTFLGSLPGPWKGPV